MKKFLVLLAVILMPAGVHAASQVWCPGVNCSQLSNFCYGSYHWCNGETSYNGYTLANGNYKYCVPRRGYYVSDPDDSTDAITCFDNYDDCHALATHQVPWVWDPSDHQETMHPADGYFFSCGSSSGYKTYQFNSDIYACAPGFYQSRSGNPLEKETDSGSSGEAGCEACADGTYSLGRTYSCTTVPANSTGGTTDWTRYKFTCNTGYYGSEPNGYGFTPSGSCTACPTADSGWTSTSQSPTTSYQSCYEYQKPSGCVSGTVRRWAESASAYGSAVQLVSTLEADEGFYTESTTATSCEPCPQGGTTDGTGSVGVNMCIMKEGISLTDDTGTYEFKTNCNYCPHPCSTADQCHSVGYGACTNGCCANACSSDYACDNALDCQSHGYSQCSGGCCTYQCSSGVYGANQAQCQLQNYGLSTNGCCSNYCSTRGTCTANFNCYANGYKTCSSGCCSGTQCPSGKACASASDCPSAYPTCSSGCCVASSCQYGSCTSNSQCTSGTCTNGCCTKPLISSCVTDVTSCSTDSDCVSGMIGFNCICTCSNSKCRCSEGLPTEEL